MEPMNWAPEHSDALRQHLARGLSFSETAKAINSKFNTSYSRNAALGRARRMGLTGDDRPKPSLSAKPASPQSIELEHGDCRYPYGGDEEGEAITFCGHPRRPGSSYCTPHFHLSREPVEPPERVVSTASLRVVDAMKGIAATRMAVRLKPLPRGHRIALIGLEPAGSARRDELSELLRDELSGVSAG